MDSIGQGRPTTPIGFRWPEESVVLEALARTVRPEQIDAVLAIRGRKKRRIRRLPLVAVVWLVICFGVWSQDNIPTIWRRLGGTLRALFAAPSSATSGAMPTGCHGRDHISDAS